MIVPLEVTDSSLFASNTSTMSVRDGVSGLIFPVPPRFALSPAAPIPCNPMVKSLGEGGGVGLLEIAGVTVGVGVAGLEVTVGLGLQLEPVGQSIPVGLGEGVRVGVNVSVGAIQRFVPVIVVGPLTGKSA